MARVSTGRIIDKGWITGGYIAGIFWMVTGALFFGGYGFGYGLGITAAVGFLHFVSDEA